MKLAIEICNKCSEVNTFKKIGDGLVECEKCGEIMPETDIIIKLEGD